MSRPTAGAQDASTSASAGGAKPRGRSSETIEIDNTRHLSEICGGHDKHLALIEQSLDVYVMARGNCLTIEGGQRDVRMALDVIEELSQRLDNGLTVDEPEVAAAIRMVLGAGSGGPRASTALEKHQIRTLRRVISPRSPTQSAYIDALRAHDLVFGIGPAGTGKTYLAVAMGVSLMMKGEVNRLVLSRPAVEAGERLGFLPGDMKEKVDPYLRPLYDALHDVMPGDQVMRRMDQGEIEVAPLAFMRGRTLSNAYVILDEAQNCTPMQIKMFLTRLGENSRMVITGDPSQVDLPTTGPHASVSGLADALHILADVRGVSKVTFSDADVVRHPLVARIVRAYNERDNG